MTMDGVEGVDERWVEANGLRFQVAEMAPADPSNERGLALCLHGFPECWYSWRHQMPLLARRGYRVWAPNLRGYGDSDRPRGIAAYSIETLMEDAAGLIDAAQRAGGSGSDGASGASRSDGASGASQTLLLGHDWGAVIAWHFAMRRVRPLNGLVICNVPHPACFRNGGWRQALKSWYAFLFQLPRLPEWLLSRRPMGEMFERTTVHPERFDAEVKRVYNEYARRPGALTAMLDYYRALGRGGGGRRQQALGFPAIDTRTLMLWGEKDVALRVETTHGTEDYVDDLTLRRIPDASHWVQQDVPERVNVMLDAWLDGREVPDGSAPAPFRTGRSD